MALDTPLSDVLGSAAAAAAGAAGGSGGGKGGKGGDDTATQQMLVCEAWCRAVYAVLAQHAPRAQRMDHDGEEGSEEEEGAVTQVCVGGGVYWRVLCVRMMGSVFVLCEL